MKPVKVEYHSENERGVIFCYVTFHKRIFNWRTLSFKTFTIIKLLSSEPFESIPGYSTAVDNERNFYNGHIKDSMVLSKKTGTVILEYPTKKGDV